MVAGPFTVIYIYAGELLPSTLRSSTISFCNSFGRWVVCAWVAVLVYLGADAPTDCVCVRVCVCVCVRACVRVCFHVSE